MATPVLMPKQGQSVETCIITEWRKKKGDQVKKGDILFSYETDKASFEEEAQEDGILLVLFFEDGDEVPVLTNVAVIGKEGESADEFRPGVKPAEKRDEKKDENISEVVETGMSKKEEIHSITAQSFPDGKIKISPRAKILAERKNVPVERLTGSGPNGRIIERDVEAYLKSGEPLTRLASEVQARDKVSVPVSGSGIGGRVLSGDLLTTPSQAEGDVEVKKLSNIRKIIAQGMLASLQNSAQLTHHMSADARKLLEYRARIKKQVETTGVANITLNDMVCFALIKALKAKPAINSHFLRDSIKTFKKVHLGIAVDTERGLMVPALRNADDLNIEELSTQLKTLAESCKKGNIDPELLASTSATFTVSNLGAFGVEMFTPVLNLPQSGILGVNTIIQRPGNLGNGIIGFIPYLGISLTYDHRALDGAPASAFLKEVKDQIENLVLNL